MDDFSRQIVSEFNTLENDKERWTYVIQHQRFLTIHVDNDDTFITVGKQEDFDEWSWEDQEAATLRFDHYIGNSQGLVTLLVDVLELPIEPV